MSHKPFIEPSLSPIVRLINKIGSTLESISGLESSEINRDTLYQAAIKATRLEDFGDPYYEEGLSVLLESAQKDVEFHFLGRTGFKRLVTLHLANRLALVEEQKRSLQGSQTPLKAPMIITGLPRSGTTYLHRMLLADPHHHAIPIWQMMRLFRHEQPDKRRAISKRELYVARLLFPSIDNIHYSRVDSPEECLTLMGLTFFSRIFWTFAPLYAYLDWYIQQDRLQPYQDYAAILQAFQNEAPGQRLTLKAPMHTASIDAIREVVPDAMFIQVHREPAQAFSSLNSLFFNLHNRSVKSFDLPRTIEHNLRTWDIELAQNIAMRETHRKKVIAGNGKDVMDAHQKDVMDAHRKDVMDAHRKDVMDAHRKDVMDAHRKDVMDVHYEQLRSDPQAVVTAIYNHFELEMTDRYRESLNAYIRENRQGNHGKHPYAAGDFGLSEANLNRRFSDYREYFGYAQGEIEP